MKTRGIPSISGQLFPLDLEEKLKCQTNPHVVNPSSKKLASDRLALSNISIYILTISLTNSTQYENSRQRIYFRPNFPIDLEKTKKCQETPSVVNPSSNKLARDKPALSKIYIYTNYFTH